nr:polyketide synthase dehydratase domain-containing protein [Actinomadura madurae]
MFTGRVSVTAQPWLADHVVSGVPLLPGTALVDAVMHAGRAAGCGTIAELTIEQPLLLPRDAVRLQVMVEAPDDRGCRAVRRLFRHAGRANPARHGRPRPG